MSDLLSKAPFQGKVEMLLRNPDRETGLEKGQTGDAITLWLPPQRIYAHA